MGLINKEWMDEYHEGLVQNLSGKADKSTTLAGYGITDAYTKTQVDAAISNIDVTGQLADYAKKTEVISAVSAEATRAQGVEATKANAADVTTALAGKADKTEVTTGLAAKQDTIGDLSTIRSGAALGATAKQPATTIAGYGITDAYTKQEVNNLVSTPHQQYVTVATKADLDAITTGSADTIYRVSNYDGTAVDATKYAEYAWDGTQFMLLTVKSAVGEVFDISEYNSGATYDTLAQAIAAVPAAAQKGGMSIKFIQSSDNKYIRYNLMADEFTTDTTQWAVDDSGVYVENPEFVYVKTDAEGKILWAIKADGDIYYGAGVPQQVKDYIEEKISSVSLDEYEDIVAFLSDYLGSDTTLKAMIDSINAQIATKVDKVEGKSLIDAEFAEGVSQVENPEFIEVRLDAEDKILWAIKTDGTVYFGAGVPSQVVNYINSKITELGLSDVNAIKAFLGDYVDSDTTLQALLDGKVDKIEGKSLIDAEYAASKSVVENTEYMEVETDSEDRILGGRKIDGTKFETIGIEIPSGKVVSENDVLLMISEGLRPVKIQNPYSGLDMSKSVFSNTHEHMYQKASIENAYKRGLRVFATSHYQPSVPWYPYSNIDWDYKDYKSKEAVDNGDLELITRNFTKSIPTINIDGESINTDTLVQIANAEHPLVKDLEGHYNIMGLLWGEPGHNIANSEAEGNNTWKDEHKFVTTLMLNELLEDETKWQFGSRLAFGTINHTYDIVRIKSALSACPHIFKAMELFNQGQGNYKNRVYRNTYDILLREGYKLWGTSVADWPENYGRWKALMTEEKLEWIEKYNNLTLEEQEQYGSAENYYLETGRIKSTRGMNCVMVPENYDSLDNFNKAKEVIKSYNAGRYYMVGFGHYSMVVSVDGNTISFRFSDVSPRVRIVTGVQEFNYENVDTVYHTVSKGDKYVRAEAEWDEGDFIYSNPIWIN